MATVTALSRALQFAQCGLGDFLGGDAEMAVELLGGRAGAECRHAHEDTVRADDLVPALAYGGLDRYPDRRAADDLLPLGRRLRAQQLEARHRYDARLYAASAQELLGVDRNRDL